MKCPHCEYKAGLNYDTKEYYGEEGDFYRLSNEVKMQRDNDSYYGNKYSTNTVYGCPKCNKLFMD
uniref:Uncharacterized protein n=1 Tax=viral metagenome TaxID=1070528 RepID=A0A6M3LBV3_9ZZZZ